MAAITAALVKELREASGAGMMDCKKALTENDGNVEAAMDWLRTKGIAKADKKSGRTAAEGLVGVKSAGNEGVVVELNSETDFVSRNEEFQALVGSISSTAMGTDGSLGAVLAADLGGKTVDASIKDAIATIGENMNLRRAAKLTVGSGAVASYVHNAVGTDMGKLGVLVGIETSGDAAAAAAIGRQIAMHVAATNPMAIGPDDLDQDVVERERAIFAEQAAASGKPENIVEKMVEGRINKFYGEVCLLKQAFVINPDVTVEAALAEADANAKISGIVRFALGEGVEKEESDFAAEVAAAAKG